MPGDYDGDGRTDFAVWRQSTGFWYIKYADDGATFSQQWGNNGAGDIAVSGDYDGDGRTDFAVWRRSTGFWYIKYADDGATFSQQWGNNGAGDDYLPPKVAGQ
jgi:hypothetical protein